MTENKERISLTLDPDLLRRIDAVCTARNEARSAFIERVLGHVIKEEEEFVSDMENPLYRALVSVIKSSPSVMGAISKLIGENLEGEALEEARRRMAEHIERGKERQAVKKQKARRLRGGPLESGA